MYTEHGQHIRGTLRLGSLPLREVVACGGQDVCESCAAEARQIEVGGVNQFAVQVYEKIELVRQLVKRNYLDSRARSLALTKLDEAELWLTQAVGVDPLVLVDELLPQPEKATAS